MNDEKFKQLNSAKTELASAAHFLEVAKSWSRFDEKSYREDAGRSCSHGPLGVGLPPAMRVKHNQETLAWAQERYDAAKTYWDAL